MKSISISVPAAISAIFEPFIYRDPILSSARGGGVVAKNAVKVRVTVRENDSFLVKNIVNGKEVDGIGILSAKKFLEYFKINTNLYIKIEQDVHIPISAGFGTSAASSMGVILALSKILNVPITLITAGTIAHIAEIEAGTGLGSVAGLVFPGDIVIVSKHGAPIDCIVDHIILPDNDDIYVILASRGKIETAKALRDPNFVERASKLGKVMIDKILKKPTIETFFEIINRFSKELGLQSNIIANAINSLSEVVIGAGQAMIGDSVFALTYNEDIPEAKKILEDVLKVKSYALPLVRLGYNIPSM